ncbi:class A beta-lactamase-related serine hydrolase [Antiquaquibacter oligotrophicus]|uniref:serine hydrolase n=1 Tax=Antiquaquibacter oligotrophicus TaxID=2880260 RepID=UPI002AC9C21E|nr:serine hydrolase [Antiquaquibacter oligotrophicus]UDF12075.1 class A beta-lactamase-related serine hydrolase [Antiquaquibacter oligotrophicus]
MVEITRARERRERLRTPRAPQHAGTGEHENFSATFAALGRLAYEGARVSASAVDLASGKTLLAIDDRIVLPTASIGKILLLIEVSARITRREFSGYGILDKTPPDAVGDSGIWQHLQAPSLPIADLASLVASTSDNLATNVLLREVGLAAVRSRTESLGLMRTALLDLVRDSRGPDDAPQLSVGSTTELTWLFGALARNEVVDALTSQRVLGWLSLNCDLSMVASAFGLDPLAHRGADHSTLLVNKTGTDAGVRAEAGAVRGSSRSVAYAVSIQFNDDSLAARLRVLEGMRTVGTDLLEYIHQ